LVFGFCRVWASTHNVTCETTAGSFLIELTDWWSPKGVSRFLTLVQTGFFDGQLLYRIVPGFLVQFGVAADPNVQAEWQHNTISDEPPKTTFQHGTVSFAGSGADSRSCHVFIAFKPDGLTLGRALHETPLGRITAGIDVLDAIQRNFTNSGYGELNGLQDALVAKGNAAAKDYPKLDEVKWCRISPAHTLNATVAMILEGRYANNFFAGDPMQMGSPQNPREEVGMCLLDKAAAIYYEDPASDFPNDFKFDLSACCTRKRGYPTCIDDISPAYALIVGAIDGSANRADLMHQAFAQLVAHAKPLLIQAQFGPRTKLLIALCNKCDKDTCANLDGNCPAGSQVRAIVNDAVKASPSHALLTFVMSFVLCCLRGWLTVSA